MSEHTLSAEDLHAFADALDRLTLARPPLTDVIAMRDILERSTVIRAEREGEDSWGSLRLTPLWKHGFVTRAARVAVLEEIAEYHRRRAEIAAMPFGPRGEEGKRLGKSWGERIRFAQKLAGDPFESEYELLLEHVLLRVSVAIAWYREEKGADPSSLADLVPRYLKSVPACPLTGQPLRYSSGTVYSIGGDLDDDGGRPVGEDAWVGADGDIVWTVRRK